MAGGETETGRQRRRQGPQQGLLGCIGSCCLGRPAASLSFQHKIYFSNVFCTREVLLSVQRRPQRGTTNPKP